jgi:predicted porin
LNNRPASFYDIGLSYSPNPWTIQGEYGIRKGHSILPDTKGWYLTDTYKVGNVTPYLTYSTVTTTSPTSDSSISSTAVYQGLAQGYQAGVLSPQQTTLFQTLALLQGGLNHSLQVLATDQSSVILGARWDFHKNADFKLQADFVKAKNLHYGAWQNVSPGWNGKSNVVSGVFDFVF